MIYRANMPIAFGLCVATWCVFGGLDRSVAEDQWSKPFSSQMVLRLAANTRSLPTHIKVVGTQTAQGMTIDLHVVVDLSPLQTNFQTLLTFQRNNCPNFSTSYVDLDVTDANPTIEGGKLRLNVNGNFDQWGCLENPVPNTKVEWQFKDLGLGIKTKVPVVVTSPSSPIKSLLARGSFTFSGIFELSSADNAIDVKTNVVFDGAPNTSVKDAVEASIADFTTAFKKITDLQTTLGLLPVQLRELGFRPNSATFSAQTGKPVALMYFSAAVSESQGSAIRESLQ